MIPESPSFSYGEYVKPSADNLIYFGLAFFISHSLCALNFTDEGLKFSFFVGFFGCSKTFLIHCKRA
ncbi:hypothetical protein [Helicobacter suis]|uniref:hypothetical protein n=1 Tax=Helicobacter suis TaxID=104628 RepID=UPI0014771895|nr:hypothetical protein [Helicobacter suis]